MIEDDVLILDMFIWKDRVKQSLKDYLNSCSGEYYDYVMSVGILIDQHLKDRGILTYEELLEILDISYDFHFKDEYRSDIEQIDNDIVKICMKGVYHE